MPSDQNLVETTAKAVAALDVVDALVEEARDWTWPPNFHTFSVWLGRVNEATQAGRTA